MAIHTSFYIPILKPQLQLGFSEVMALQLHHQVVKPWVYHFQVIPVTLFWINRFSNRGVMLSKAGQSSYSKCYAKLPCYYTFNSQLYNLLLKLSSVQCKLAINGVCTYNWVAKSREYFSQPNHTYAEAPNCPAVLGSKLDPFNHPDALAGIDECFQHWYLAKGAVVEVPLGPASSSHTRLWSS